MPTNPYYQASGQPVSLSHGSSATIRTEFGTIQSGFDAVATALGLKGSVSGQNWTGTHDFSGATVRIKQPVVDADPVSYGYVKNLIIAGTVPTAAGDAGKFLGSNGSTTSFQPIAPAVAGQTLDTTSANVPGLTIQNIANNGDILAMKGTGTKPWKTMRVNAGNLEVVDSVYGNVLLRLTDAGVLSAATITMTSDERKKSHWRRAPADLIERLAAMRKVGLFRWKKSGIASLGVGAQSLEAILPEAVHTDDSPQRNKTVNYGGAAMVGVVELCRRVIELEARLSRLEAKK